MVITTAEVYYLQSTYLVKVNFEIKYQLALMVMKMANYFMIKLKIINLLLFNNK